MIAAGHQPNYLPWLGFFDKMSKCNVFIIEDNVQYEQQGFQNRNKVKTFMGVKWLTVPVEHEGKPVRMDEVKVANKAEKNWASRHWLTVKYNYCKAPYWSDYADFFEQTYSQMWDRLIDLNMHMIYGVKKFLKIETPIVLASSLNVSGKKSDFVLEQCKTLGATTHLSGTGGRDYLDLESFSRAGIKVVFQDFRHPVYQQLHGDFVPDLSAVDYLFCTGARDWGIMVNRQGRVE